MVDRHLDQPSEERDPEGQLANRGRKARAEAKRIAVVAHPAEALDGGDPCARRRAHMHSVAHVALEVVQVHQSCFRQVVVGQPQVPNLSRDHGLRA